MKEVFLKKLILKNFKKIQDLTVEFTDKNTFICGGNGTGKTTLQDAFLWLLFGKDSTNSGMLAAMDMVLVMVTSN